MAILVKMSCSSITFSSNGHKCDHYLIEPRINVSSMLEWQFYNIGTLKA